MNKIKAFTLLQPFFGNCKAYKLAYSPLRTLSRYVVEVITLGLVASLAAYLIVGFGFWLGLRWHFALVAGALCVFYEIGRSHGN